MPNPNGRYPWPVGGDAIVLPDSGLAEAARVFMNWGPGVMPGTFLAYKPADPNVYCREIDDVYKGFLYYWWPVAPVPPKPDALAFYLVTAAPDTPTPDKGLAMSDDEVAYRYLTFHGGNMGALTLETTPDPGNYSLFSLGGPEAWGAGRGAYALQCYADGGQNVDGGNGAVNPGPLTTRGWRDGNQHWLTWVPVYWDFAPNIWPHTSNFPDWSPGRGQRVTWRPVVPTDYSGSPW